MAKQTEPRRVQDPDDLARDWQVRTGEARAVVELFEIAVECLQDNRGMDWLYQNRENLPGRFRAIVNAAREIIDVGDKLIGKPAEDGDQPETEPSL